MNKMIFCFLFSAVFIFCSCSKGSTDIGSGYPVYEHYTDIPDVTEAEKESMEKIKNKYQSLVIAMNYGTEAFYLDDERIGGYTTMFCQWLTELFDIKFETRIYEWDELIEGLDSYEINFTGELTATPERLEKYYMTEAIAQRAIKIFRLENSEKLSEIIRERVPVYAFLDGSTAYGYILEASDTDFEHIFVSDYASAVKMLEEGSIDAFFEDGPAEAAFDIYANITAEEFFPLVYAPVSLTTADPELKPVIDILQKYLQKGLIYHLSDMYNKANSEYLKFKFYNKLSDEEQEYIEKNQGIEISFAAEYDNYPSSFYNEQEDEWQGMAHDVLKEISSLTGLTFKPGNERGTTWAFLLEKLDNGEYSFITELIPSPEREGKYLWTDNAYTTDYYALISRSDTENIKMNQVIYSRVALAEGTAYEEVFKIWFPDHGNIVLYKSTDDCFLALEKGEVDFVMASRNLMLSMTNYYEKPGFKLNIIFNRTYESSFGFNKDEDVLCSIMSKAQKLVNVDEITENWTHKVFDYSSKLAKARMPYLIGLAVLLVAIVGLMAFFLLKKRRDGIKLEYLVKERTAELEVQTQAAKVASNAKSDFLSRMSHEIRTPLNAIIGMAQVAKQVPGQPEKALDANSEIITASNHLLGVLNDVLDMSKIESGKFTLASEPFEFKRAMAEVANMIRQRCTDKNIMFIANYNEIEDFGVFGDKLRLNQVLINLLGNAVKFTGDNGTVSLLTNIIKIDETEAELEFIIKDTGIGMTGEQMKHLFIPFEQADNSVAVHYGGTGLGLAISQNMVEKMGGMIIAESIYGNGSSFKFTLNFKRADYKEKAKQEPASVLDFRGAKLLLAEDIEINRIILKELLNETNLVIGEALDGRQAFEMFRDSKPGEYKLVLMDIQMPNMNGYEAAEAIRGLDREDSKTVPIIAMTANAYREDVEKALESGMNGHLSKPVDIDEVKKVLSEYLLD